MQKCIHFTFTGEESSELDHWRFGYNCFISIKFYLNCTLLLYYSSGSVAEYDLEDDVLCNGVSDEFFDILDNCTCYNDTLVLYHKQAWCEVVNFVSICISVRILDKDILKDKAIKLAKA